jgi:3-ketosteroid 9alpha-monooxygenase subunit B
VVCYQEVLRRTFLPEPRVTKPKPFEVVVTDVIEETPDTATLVFEPDQPVDYRAGQFLTIDPHQFKVIASQTAYLEDLKGRKELVRAYSVCSAPGEPLAITIKEEPYLRKVSLHAPLLSPLLTYGIHVGMRMKVVGLTGPYTLPPDIELRAKHVVHVVAGSGVVPNFSILKDALKHHPTVRHTVLDSNKTWGDVIFREALTRLAAEHPERLQVVHFLTRQQDLSGLPAGVHTGRINRAALESLVPDRAAAMAYVCGPAITSYERRAALEKGVSPEPRFLETTIGYFQELGFPNERIKRESFA